MKLTREKALELHRKMWSDMQKELGDTPDLKSRKSYKRHWCKVHGFEDVMGDCFLCEYIENFWLGCKDCPIKWPGIDCTSGDISYRYSPISKILALPEREENIGTN